jgi:PII-like signaling protein
VEIVATSEAMRRFVPLLDPLIPRGSAALSPVRIVTYSTGPGT